MLPLVSIVLATYNGEKYLRPQLDSLINQTYKNIEIIIVDDCSTDKTVEIITEYKNNYEYIHFYQQEKNVGYIKNFEFGLTKFSGEWVAICDQDDIWLNEKIEICIQHAIDEAGLYHDSVIIIGDDLTSKQKISDSRKCVDCRSPLHYAIGTIALGHTMMVHRKIVKAALPIPENMPYDAWLGFLSTLFNGLYYIDKPLVYYRQHEYNLYGSEKNKSIHNKERKKFQDYTYKIYWLNYKLNCMSKKCLELGFNKEAEILYKLAKSTLENNLKNRIVRASLYFKYRHDFLIYKKRNNLRKILYSLKMFFKRVS